MLLDDGLVETRGLLELALLHEEHVGDVQLPDVNVVAELDALAEDPLHLYGTSKRDRIANFALLDLDERRTFLLPERSSRVPSRPLPVP